MVCTLRHARLHRDTCTPGSWYRLEQSVREESYINDSDCQAGGHQRTWSNRDIWTWNSWWRRADRPEESIIDQKGSFSSKLTYINTHISMSDWINFNFKKLAKGLCFFSSSINHSLSVCWTNCQYNSIDFFGPGMFLFGSIFLYDSSWETFNLKFGTWNPFLQKDNFKNWL